MVIMTYRFKVALRLEIPLAGHAIVVKGRLTKVLLQTILVGEDPFTTRTIIVGVFVMILQFAKVVEMFIAMLAIWVTRTLNPMFFQPQPGWKVLRASIASVVTGGIVYMLMKSRPRSKRTFAAFAVGHSIRRKSVSLLGVPVMIDVCSVNGFNCDSRGKERGLNTEI